MSEPKPFEWLTTRSAGILLHPTSLPSDQAVGVLGASAREFIDFLKDAGMRYWQVLPLGPTGYADSPYASFSAFAGNPYLIDMMPLTEHGILQFSDLDPLRALPADHVDFGALYRIKWPLLRLAHKRFVEQKRAYLPNYGLLDDFRRQHAAWLEPFCAFMALKERFGGVFWGKWPEECRTPEGARATPYWQETAQARDAHAFFQYLFFGQWHQVLEYAHSAGVEVIGDLPIFVAIDSADVWSRPGMFEMSVPGKPDFVAGVPPDYFSETGQLWGNPLYDWQAMKRQHYSWWVDRFAANNELFDVVRIDHFRGFYDYWRIPASAKDARTGEWADGPREDLFKEVARRLPGIRIIAEDLGEIHQAVHDFRDALGTPGMAILQFAFGDDPDNIYLPHNLARNLVVYPGTHDNNTATGWYDAASPDLQDRIRRYLRVDGHDIAWDLVRCCYQSVANLTVIPMQDLMALGAEARMNTPATDQGNWQWRMTADAFRRQRGCAHYLRELATIYGRLPAEPAS